jgi:hypothetical protein
LCFLRKLVLYATHCDLDQCEEALAVAGAPIVAMPAAATAAMVVILLMLTSWVGGVPALELIWLFITRS